MENHFKQDCLILLKDRLTQGSIDRRTFLTGLVALGALSAINGGPAKAAGGDLVVTNWGGDAVPAFKSAFTDGFGASSGLNVKIDGSGSTKGAMKAQFDSGTVRWDVCDADPGSTKSLGDAGMIEKVDYAIVDKGKVEEGFAYEYSIANYFFSYVIAYDASKFAGDPPKSWADFWDVKKYPGKRTMYKWMAGSLEAALMADGVPMDKLYPLDMDRAFAKLEELKPHIVSYWDSGAESQQLLRDGEVSMGLVWHTRANLVETDTNGAVSWTYAQGIMAPSGWTVIKGNPAGKDAAMKFIAYCQDPARQVVLLETLGSGPANPAAHALVPAKSKRLDCSSPENRALQVAMDMDWYAANSNKALERYLAMVAG
ncbi:MULTISPECIES: ABC transporter substrate-binding protein [Mesorhizobium]|uniref:ABC transporter substrate-binding protein n=1 Tax=Mesorhizobium TaxID=68287 RepID=UPI0010A97AE8|nr:MULTISPECIES: ABC transporter substrate-binding protein [Mesorhizobium]